MKIVVTTDGSDRSLRILPHAAALAKATHAEILLTRVLDADHDLHGGSIDEVAARWKEELAGWAEGAGVPLTPVVPVLANGEDVSEAIKRTAVENGAGIIAMASGGTGALHHALMGSVTMSVVSKGGIPVMVVTDATTLLATPRPYNLLITTDGSENSADVFHQVAPLLEGSTVKVLLLRVYEPRLGDSGDRVEIPAAEAALGEIRALLPESVPVEMRVERVHDFERVESAILRVASQSGAEAIAISTHGYSAPHHLLAGSVALAILKKSHLPVILARR